MSKKHYLSNEDISILCSELASVVSSGLTITDGILVILQDGEDKNKAALLEKILSSIENGSSSLTISYRCLRSEKAPAGLIPCWLLLPTITQA